MSASANFDWVRERAKCSLGVIFEALAVAVKQDVDSITELLKEKRVSKVVFFYKRDRGTILVTRERTDVNEPVVNVTFTLSASEISIDRDTETARLSVVPRLNDQRQCRLMVDGRELEIWQVCQLALDGLFFDGNRASAPRMEVW